jgi:hypothetical protein
VRHSAAESKIVQFPTARSAGRNAVIEEQTMDQSAKLPISLCVMIWTALAVAGWGAFDVALQFV